jgi:hypothetical protein
MAVEAIVPDEPTVSAEELSPTLLEKSLTVETSKPAGGVIVIPADILVPDIEKLVGEEEAVPYVVLTEESVPELLIVGLTVPVILKSSISHTSLAELFNNVILIFKLLLEGKDEIATVLYPSVVLAPPPDGVKSIGVEFPS